MDDKNKVLLVTLEGTSNFGNRLQHYALQHTIESLGFTIDNLMVRDHQSLKEVKFKNSIKYFLSRCGLKKYLNGLSQGRRAVKLINFNKRFLTNMLRMRSDEVFKRNWSEYSFAVTGSDQVWHNWHSKYIPDELRFYYLEFIEVQKRVSYAPSFGFTAFPEEDLTAHQRGLNEMYALSCREKEGCELIHALTGREAQKVLDPTLLLTAEKWSQIEKEPDFKVPDHYLLKLFLGNVIPEYHAEINQIAQELELQILDIGNKDTPGYYDISPDEFIWLVHHADFVCTDSFHTTVFAILFERNLRVFRRKAEKFEDMFGRLHDLLKPLGLMSVVYGEGERRSTVLDREAQKYLSVERERSLQYLRDSLKINK